MKNAVIDCRPLLRLLSLFLLIPQLCFAQLSVLTGRIYQSADHTRHKPVLNYSLRKQILVLRPVPRDHKNI